MAPNIFRLLLLATAIYAFVRGGREERLTAAICLLGSAITHIVISPLHQRFQGLETAVLLVDLAMLGGFVAIAIRSDRFWPLWMAGVQLTTVLGHAMKQVDSELLPRAYAASLGFWAYWTLVILAVGVWRHHRRKLAVGELNSC